jgi:membrane-associated phospholipid phosphatase
LKKALLIILFHAIVLGLLLWVDLPYARWYHNFLDVTKKTDNTLVASTVANLSNGVLIATIPDTTARTLRIPSSNMPVVSALVEATPGTDRLDFWLVQPRVKTAAYKWVRKLTRNDFWLFFEQLGLIFYGALACIFIWFYDPPKRKYIALFFIVSIITGSTVEVLKMTTGKVRPSALFDHPDQYAAMFLPFLKGWVMDAPLAFPSGHATQVFVTSTFLAILYPRARWVLYITAAITGFSRSVTEAHWLSDIYGGFLFGHYTMKLGFWVFYKVEPVFSVFFPKFFHLNDRRREKE